MRGNSDRFYLKEGLGEEMICVEDPGLLKQWHKVLRLKPGDQIRLFDGSGWEYNYELRMTNYECGNGVSFSKNDGVNLKLTNNKFIEKPFRQLILCFGLLKNRERTEYLIEKCTELGVTQFQPLICDNSQIDHLKNRSRLEKKIIEASEQSGRVYLPVINDELRMTNYECDDNNVKICLDICDDDEVSCRGTLLRAQSAALFVGPEGGWSDQEREYFHKNNFQFCQISKNILRAETAAVVGVGVCQFSIYNS